MHRVLTLVDSSRHNDNILTKNLAKFPHNPLLHYACRSLSTENNGKNNATAVGLCAVFVVSWQRNKGLHTLNRMHNEVWGCAEISPRISIPVILMATGFLQCICIMLNMKYQHQVNKVS